MKYHLILNAIMLVFITHATYAINRTKDPKNDYSHPVPSWMVCPNVNPLNINWTNDIDEYVGMTYFEDRKIWLSWNDFQKFSLPLQKFVFFHECGHAQGELSETGADDYAYQQAKLEGWWSDTLLKEVCKSVGDQDNRCNVLRIKNSMKDPKDVEPRSRG